MKSKIIVLTPIKNEAWILAHFLSITSKFADHIIILDQMSNDGSKAIAKKFEKVILLENNNSDYDEAYRQNILINKARELFPDYKRILITLDADEFISANGIVSLEWKLITSAKKGTVLYFEKPDLYLNATDCVRYIDNKWPLGIVDDENLIHTATKIHSIRVPIHENSEKIYLNEIIFLHTAYLRPSIQRAKFRFYSVKENINNSNPWYRRRRRYRAPNHLLIKPVISQTPTEWLAHEGFSLLDIKDSIETWHNTIVAEDICNKGSIYFWLDDIWDISWNRYNRKQKIISPPMLLTFFLRLFDKYILK
ncbi:glycosyltransferase family 2 protein [Pedobacter sp. SL55]|uniref:glycosyltransferase family 2 protein n=1 Tax=Pedobacter sp. SL55 TaxID=2995161 RepID=UPI0022714B6A|nr:glycosyltransferase family 2 protein [Pedobacter sp. SL55]WAC39057.1 glycosyltransferase family 2 protein [Pedobacter sp. SL55]